MPLPFPTEVLAGHDDAEALRFCSCRISRSNFFWLKKAFKSSTGTPLTVTLGFGTGEAVKGIELVTFSLGFSPTYPVIFGWFWSTFGSSSFFFLVDFLGLVEGVVGFWGVLVLVGALVGLLAFLPTFSGASSSSVLILAGF